MDTHAKIMDAWTHDVLPHTKITEHTIHTRHTHNSWTDVHKISGYTTKIMDSHPQTSWTHAQINHGHPLTKKHEHTHTWMTIPAVLILTKRFLSFVNRYHRTILVAARRFANRSAKYAAALRYFRITTAFFKNGWRDELKDAGKNREVYFIFMHSRGRMTIGGEGIQCHAWP